MARIKATEVPTIARGGKKSKYAAQMAELTELLQEDNFGSGEAVAFEDVTKDDLDALVTALRKAGKDMGRKVKTAYAEGTLYAHDNGEIGSENESAAAVRKAAKASA
jgi:hypothetical protein